MARLTKAAIIAAHDEVSELVEGFNPPIDTGVKQADLEVRFTQVLLDIGLDDEDRAELSDETVGTIDRLLKKFPDMKPSPDEDDETEEAEAEVVEDEKPKKKGKKDKKEKKGKKEKKSKKEEPAEEEAQTEKPAKEKKGKKSKKAKKGGNDELIEQINSVPYKELKNIVKDNDVFEGFPAVGLSNDMFREELINVLNGEKTCEEVKEAAKAARAAGKAKAKDNPKKEKKSKKAAKPTLTEQVEAFEDLDELKAFCKENKDSFPGVKAKKFDKVKKLRKAMLKVVVELEKPKRKARSGKTLEETRKERDAIIAFATKLIKKNGSIDRKELTEQTIAAFPESEKKVKDTISYGKNEKYNKFEKLLVEVDGVIAFEGTKLKGAKPEKKKGKKAKEAEKPEQKADKKSKKKDKKKDKKKKKK